MRPELHSEYVLKQVDTPDVGRVVPDAAAYIPNDFHHTSREETVNKFWFSSALILVAACAKGKADAAPADGPTTCTYANRNTGSLYELFATHGPTGWYISSVTVES